ncbi:MAG: UvrD-helicase domain-containing protein, partial [Candidatus Omnitrophica bacterium]|nr:UvrD-helicase domain-containing protein [Candidatus Omnitrophota bacterium]
LTSEISTIYKKNNKVRKVHNIIFAPDFDVVEKIQQKLSNIGNITSDGRPILGFDSRNLLDLVLNVSEKILFVPAHIWTPWFSALGEKSGFDTIEECYSDLSGYIYAVETGLSTDAPMNWMCSFLDKYTLISNSDAHSPEKLGRNANIFDTGISYNDITNAIKTGNPKQFLGTIDLFPQEGKYHYAGHRKCSICWDPLETLKNKNVCSVCGKMITLGVINRIVELSDRKDLTERKNRLPFHSIIPLKKILSEINGVGPNSKKITNIYNVLIQKTCPELELLLDFPLDKIKQTGSELLMEGIRRMRNKEIYIKEGFDGEYGVIKVFRQDEIKQFSNQKSLFGNINKNLLKPEKRKIINFDLKEYQYLKNQKTQDKHGIDGNNILDITITDQLNSSQREAVEHPKGPLLILAGPGTGKTKTLTHRIANFIQNKGVLPENILAVTFTNKAANTIKERLNIILENKAILPKLQISTFHGLGLFFIKENYKIIGRDKNFSVIDETDKELILKNLDCPQKEIKNISNFITAIKKNLETEYDNKKTDLKKIIENYDNFLKVENLLDFDDLLFLSVQMLKTNTNILQHYREEYKWILIDEYQDINFIQYQLLKLLMPDKHSNICAIGDPNQSIYGFRGADIKYIKKFTTDYPDSSIYELKKSYRCSDYILKASGNLINHQNKNVLKGLQKGVKIKIVKNNSDKSEAEFVARSIENMIGGLRFFSMDSEITQGNNFSEIKSLSDFAVLCRIKNQFKTIEKAFNDHSIPYQSTGDTSLMRQRNVKLIIDLLSFSLNPKNNFLKLKNKKMLSEIKDTEILKINEIKPVKDKVKTIIEKHIKELTSQDKIILKNLIEIAKNFGNNLKNFLDFFALCNETDIYKKNTENVNLMTLHAAKGLEFKCVFIVGCENRLLPYSLFENQKSNFEEEKRLLYVGMTRAEEYLILS